MTVVASLLTLAYLCTSKDADNFVCLLAVLGGDMGIAGELFIILIDFHLLHLS